jgi:hypothetical protein
MLIVNQCPVSLETGTLTVSENNEGSAMKTSALYLPGVPMVGQSGQRDNVAVLMQLMQLTLPRGTVHVLTIGHDSACPCVEGDRDLTRCLCERVNLYLEAITQPEPGETQ